MNCNTPYRDIQTYTPIDCGFHDQLLEKSHFRIRCLIRYRNEGDQIRQTGSRITDVFTRVDGEFLRLEDGTLIRLDELLAVEALPRNE